MGLVFVRKIQMVKTVRNAKVCSIINPGLLANHVKVRLKICVNKYYF